jgi:hypothetical protein
MTKDIPGNCNVRAHAGSHFVLNLKCSSGVTLNFTTLEQGLSSLLNSMCRPAGALMSVLTFPRVPLRFTLG